MKSFVAFVALAIVASAYGVEVDGPGNQWIRKGGSMTLACRSESPLATCSWETPYNGLYTFGAAKIAEGGRIRQFTTKSGGELECGVVIEPLEAKDEGLWSCHVGVVTPEGELETGLGVAALTIATEPMDVIIDHSSSKTNESDSSDLEIDCVAKAANPEPKFAWFLEEELMENPVVRTEQLGKDWVQTLIISPDEFRVNGTLKCSVSHFGLAAPIEAITPITLAGMNLEVGPRRAKTIDELPIPIWGIAVVPCILLLFIPVHLYAYRRENRAFWNSHCAKYFSRSSDGDEDEKDEKDVEAGEENMDEDLKKEMDEDKEKQDEEKEVEDEKTDDTNDEEDVKEESKVEKECAWKKFKAWMSPKQLQEKKLESESEKKADEPETDEKKDETADETKQSKEGAEDKPEDEDAKKDDGEAKKTEDSCIWGCLKSCCKEPSEGYMYPHMPY